MYCKICGEHLYKNITFENLFKLHYYVHKDCENLINKKKEYDTVPFLDKLLFLDYLLEENNEKTDKDFVYHTYSDLLFERLLNSEEWSIVLFVEKPLISSDLILITKLAERSVLICQLFHENFMKVE